MLEMIEAVPVWLWLAAAIVSHVTVGIISYWRGGIYGMKLLAKKIEEGRKE